MFRYNTKLGSKRVEQVQLMHNFVQWSRFGIFRNECTRPTPLDPKLMCVCVSSCLGAFANVSLLHKTRCKRVEQVQLMQKLMPLSRIRIFLNERTQSTPLDTKLTFWCISYYLGAFGTIWLPYETRCKTGRIIPKVHATKSRWIFRNEHTRSTPLDPKLMFWGVSYYLCAFGAVWLPYETRCKTDRTSAKVRATKSRWNFSQRTHPIHPIGP